MVACLIRFELAAGPPDKLPADVGFLESAEEHGLLWVVRSGSGFHDLPPGAVWGDFAEIKDALAAFDKAIEGASALLGFELDVVRAVALPLDAIWPELAGDEFTACLFRQMSAPPRRTRPQQGDQRKAL
jgi:hypothetical protein